MTLRKPLLLLFLAILSFFSPALAHADSDPWGEVFLPDGSLNPGLVDLGTTTDTPSWMALDLPFNQTLPLSADYHRFQTESGNIVVLPSTTTLFFMAMNPVESGLTASDGMVANGAGGLTTLLGLAVGDYLDWERVQADHPQYVDPDQFWNAVLSGEQDAWSYFSGWSFITNLLQISWEDEALRSAYLLYLDGVKDCAALPGGCAGVVNPAGLNPPAARCPSSTVRLGIPSLQIQKIAPDYPLVIGQDLEARRGADVRVSVTVPPVIFTWYEPVYERRTYCRPAESGEQPNCRIGEESIADDGILYSRLVFVGCRTHTERLPDPVVSLKATANLSAESMGWITDGLSQTHYEAYLRNPSLALIPGIGSWSGGCAGGGTCTALGEALRIPFADPGTYILRLEVQTRGTWFRGTPISAPRLLGEDGELLVYVTLPALIH